MNPHDLRSTSPAAPGADDQRGFTSFPAESSERLFNCKLHKLIAWQTLEGLADANGVMVCQIVQHLRAPAVREAIADEVRKGR